MLFETSKAVIVGIVAVAAPTLQQIAECGNVTNTPAKGPVFEVTSADKHLEGVPTEFAFAEASLGPGKPCPKRVTWAFGSGTGKDGALRDQATIVVDDPPTRTLPDGSCAVGPLKQAFTFEIPDGFDVARVQALVEVAADPLTVAQGSKITQVYDPSNPNAPKPGAIVPVAAEQPVTTSPPTTPGSTPGGTPGSTPGGTPGSTPGGTTGPLAFDSTVQYDLEGEFNLVTGQLPAVAVAKDASGKPVALGVVADRATGDDALIVRAVQPNGALGAQTEVELGPDVDPIDVTSADVDKDGRPDFVIAGTNASNPRAYYVHATESGFDTPRSTPLPSSFVSEAVKVADADGDGNADLVLTGDNGVVVSRWISAGIPGGLFTSSGQEHVPPVPLQGLAVTDLDADGKLDIAGANPSNEVLAYKNASLPGTLSFADHATTTGYSGQLPLDVIGGDLDADGKQDLLTLNHGSASLAALYGSGSLTAFTEGLISPVGEGPVSVAIGDADRDGRPDVASANYGSGNVSVLRQSGPRSFEAAVPVPIGEGANDVELADLNGDGRLDVIGSTRPFGPDPSDKPDGVLAVALAKAPPSSREAVARASAARKAKPITLKTTGKAALRVQSFGKTAFLPTGGTQAKGVRLIGTLGGKVSSKAQRKKAPKAVLDLLDGVFAGQVDALRVPSLEIASPVFATGHLLGRARKDARLRGCLKVTRKGKQQQATLVGATKGLRRVRITATLPPLSLDGIPSARSVTLKVTKGGRALGMPKACRALARKLPTPPRR